MILFTLTFEKGTYHQALEYYYFAREWVLHEGLCHTSKIYGTVNHPVHPDSPLGDKIVPDELASDPQWETAVNIVAEDEEMAAVVAQLKAPPFAKLERVP